MVEAASLAALASRFIDTESVPWVETSPGNKMKVIYHDPESGMLTILSRLEPGSGIPAHRHEDLEQTFVLEGSLVDDEGECTAGNFVIRAVDRSGVVTTFAGVAGSRGHGDGIGSQARFADLRSVAAGELGNIYVLDGDSIRKIDPAGVVTTLPKEALESGQGHSIQPSCLGVGFLGKTLYLVEGPNNAIWKVESPNFSSLPIRKGS